MVVRGLGTRPKVYFARYAVLGNGRKQLFDVPACAGCGLTTKAHNWTPWDLLPTRTMHITGHTPTNTNTTHPTTAQPILLTALPTSTQPTSCSLIPTPHPPHPPPPSPPSQKPSSPAPPPSSPSPHPPPPPPPPSFPPPLPHTCP